MTNESAIRREKPAGVPTPNERGRQASSDRGVGLRNRRDMEGGSELKRATRCTASKPDRLDIQLRVGRRRDISVGANKASHEKGERNEVWRA